MLLIITGTRVCTELVLDREVSSELSFELQFEFESFPVTRTRCVRLLIFAIEYAYVRVRTVFMHARIKKQNANTYRTTGLGTRVFDCHV